MSTSMRRPPREEDLPRLVPLLSRDPPEPVDEDSVRRSWASPGAELELDARIDGDAYALVESLDAESLTGANLLYERAGMRVSARFTIVEQAAP
jgi:hypothetical protein